MLIEQIMNPGLYTLNPETSIKEAAMQMYQWKVGAVIIGDKNDIKGIFSERDLLNKVVGPGLSIEMTTLEEVMSRGIVTISKADELEDALKIMEEKNIRHLPVVDENNTCVGMLGMRDLMKAYIQSIEKEKEGIMSHIMDLMEDDE